MPKKITLNLPDRLVNQYDNLENRSEFLSMCLDSWPVLEQIATNSLKSVFSIKELTALINLFDGIPFTPKLANKETLLNVIGLDFDNVINDLGDFEIFFLIKFLCDANSKKNNKIATVDLLK